MLELIRNSLTARIAVVAALLIMAFALPATTTHAQEIDKNTKCGSNITGLDPANCDTDVAGSGSDIEGLIRTIINVFSVIVGSISVIMIIIGGFRYITSAGDSNSVSGAKNTILYAIVGLIIVAFAQIIVQFVLQRTVTD